MTVTRLIAGLAPLLALCAMAAPAPVAAQSSFPPGSYQQTCKSLSLINGHRLSARCKRRDGTWSTEKSKIDANDCWKGRVENIDGVLRCERPGDGDNWRDDYDSARRDRDFQDRQNQWEDRADQRQNRWHEPDVILYEHVGYDGRRTPIDRDTPNLASVGMNDTASSIRINHGVWRLCEHLNYKGRCWTLSANEPNFVPRGINDVISSIRRIQ